MRGDTAERDRQIIEACEDKPLICFTSLMADLWDARRQYEEDEADIKRKGED